MAGYTRTVAQISGDDRLTPEAKAVDLAMAYTKAQTDLSGVRATVERPEAETVEHLASSVFVIPHQPADVIAARDTDDRAARYTTPEEAQLALSRAVANGDKSLARSIALRAYQETQGPFGGGAWHFASDLTSSDPRAHSEPARASSAGWDIHELLFHRQKALEDGDLRRYAAQLGLDVAAFDRDCASASVLWRIQRDVDSGLASGQVLGTPTLFIDGVCTAAATTRSPRCGIRHGYSEP